MTEALPQRAGIYCRLSYAPDGSLEKVDRQETQCRERAVQLGWAISEAHVFKDNSRSAWQRHRKRPGWAALLKALEAGEIDRILVYHGDRLMRQPYDLERLLAIADSRDLRLASVSGVRNLDNPEDRFVLRIEVAQACRESDNTSRRVRNGLTVRAAKGLSQVGGHRPFGFGVQTGTRKKTDAKTGETVEVPIYDLTQHVPEEAAYAAEGVERQLAGLSQIGVIRWLNTKCTTTAGNPWTAKTWRDYVLSPRIAGLLLHDGVLKKAAWKPIISPETWQDIKAQYERNAKENPYPGRERKYMLSTVADCGGCGATMRGRPVGGKDKPQRRTRYTQYYCPVCKKVSRKTDHVDAFVDGKVLSLLNDPRFITELHAQGGDEGKSVSAQITELERRKRQTKEQLDNLARNPDIDISMALTGLASFDTEIAELRLKLAATAQQRRLARMVGYTWEQWKAEPVTVRSEVVRDLFRVAILPTDRRGPGFDPETVRLERRPLAA
ncbi:recombinase family protein [Streptomyces sp. NPDC048389]|uniref:recombinase family protein n=1 Tax=Streptomyces sp. NPDC048389 TaxID=3154622 RepID=UPI003451A0DF